MPPNKGGTDVTNDLPDTGVVHCKRQNHILKIIGTRAQNTSRGIMLPLVPCRLIWAIQLFLSPPTICFFSETIQMFRSFATLTPLDSSIFSFCLCRFHVSCNGPFSFLSCVRSCHIYCHTCLPYKDLLHQDSAYPNIVNMNMHFHSPPKHNHACGQKS
jgi:hypothetical protein